MNSARQRIDRRDADEAPDGDEIIDLDLRPEFISEERRHFGAVGGDALLAAEEGAQDE
jgi:hypothetical protein